MYRTAYRSADVDGLKVFYRDVRDLAGDSGTHPDFSPDVLDGQ